MKQDDLGVPCDRRELTAQTNCNSHLHSRTGPDKPSVGSCVCVGRALGFPASDHHMGTLGLELKTGVEEGARVMGTAVM